MKRVVACFWLCLVAALAAVSGSQAASSPSIVQAGGASFPNESYILTLPAARPLTTSDVTVTENGKVASGVHVVRQGTGTSRSAVVIVIDESLTMKGKPIKDAFAAARAFAKGANPNETIAVLGFNGTIKVVHGFTTSASQLNQSLQTVPQLGYGTKNNEALQEALAMIKAEDVSSGSIILMTDGQSVGSRVKPEAIRREVAAAHVRIFSVGLYSPVFQPAAMQHLANITGGEYVEANGPTQLGPILVQLGHRLSSEYLVSYKSPSSPGLAVNVKVAVRGFEGAASTSYESPKLVLKPAPAYHPSQTSKIIESNYTMLGIAALFAFLIGFAVLRVGKSGSDKLVDRVGDFVSISQGRRVETREKTPRKSFFSSVSRPQRAGGRLERLGVKLELAGLEMPPLQAVILMIFATAIVVMILGLLAGPLGFLIGLATPLVLRWFVNFKVTRTRRLFADQLPDNLDVLASSLRAGHSLVGALTVVTQDAAEPSKREFQRVLTEEQFGAPLEDAFKVAVDRMQSRDLDQVALVARLQREMGSNAAEVLDQVVVTVRAKMEIRRLVRGLTAQGRLSRWILTLLPIVMGLGLELLSSSYMAPLLHKTAGQLLLGFACVMVCFGSYLIGKIVDIRLA